MKLPGNAVGNVFGKKNLDGLFNAGAFGKGPNPLKPIGGKDSLKALIEDGRNKTLLTRSKQKDTP